jgi:putative SOS response-associated peptidase YedK
MPPPPKFGGPPVTNIRNTTSPHWRSWLAAGLPEQIERSITKCG